MNANMRNGRSIRQSLRAIVAKPASNLDGNASAPSRARHAFALLTGLMAGLSAMPASATGRYDTQLERWAIERIAAKVGDLRGSHEPGERLVLVSEETLRNGPAPLNTLPTDDQRDAFAALGIPDAPGFKFPGRLQIRMGAPAPDASVYVASRRYTGAFTTLGR
jgi:hypothetical protein